MIVDAFILLAGFVLGTLACRDATRRANAAASRATREAVHCEDAAKTVIREAKGSSAAIVEAIDQLSAAHDRSVKNLMAAVARVAKRNGGQ